MSTSLEKESSEQQRWRLKDDAPYAQYIQQAAEHLLKNEFLDPDQLIERRRLRLQALLQYVSRHVPYYTAIFRERDIRTGAFDLPNSLHPLPALTKTMLRESFEELRGHNLPRLQKVVQETRTSGTTGQPVRVLQSRMSMLYFGLLKQREYRWFRFDPAKTMAYIRPPDEFPHDSYDPQTRTYLSHYWPYVGRWWETGQAFGCDHTDPVDDQISWLARTNPHYLVTESGDLECLAFGQQEKPVPDHLSGILSVSHQLTPGMRKRAESTFGLRVDQNYGLNEIGIVAIRCPEEGRYHFHPEHCLAEIVDEEGQACKPGETGRLLITALNNWAMPLIRYDTDDLAETTDGPCPCGRSLPTFGRVVGRYRRIAYLPEGTWGYWQNFRVEIESIPEDDSSSLRQYQLHQNRDGSFEFRFLSVAEPPETFYSYVTAAWSKATAPDSVPFSMIRMEKIPSGSGHKLQNFTSDFSPSDEE